MTLLCGAKIKYSGQNADAVLDEIEQSLRGCCSRRKSALVITKTVQAKLVMRDNVRPSGSSLYDPIDLSRHRSNGE